MPERKDNLIAERLLDGGSKMEFDDAKLVVKATPRNFLAFFCGLPYYSAGSSDRSKHTCIARKRGKHILRVGLVDRDVGKLERLIWGHYFGDGEA
jgi:hypothetical protein